MIGIRKAIAKIAACRCNAKYSSTPDTGHDSDCVRYVKGGQFSDLQAHPLVWLLGDIYGKKTWDIAKAVQRIWDAEENAKQNPSRCPKCKRLSPSGGPCECGAFVLLPQ